MPPPIRGDNVGHAGGADQDVRLPGELLPIRHAGVDHGDGGVGPGFLERQQHRKGAAEGRAPPDDHHPPAGDRDPVVDEHGLDAERGAGPGPARLSEGQVAEVGRVKPVGVLGRIGSGHGLVEVEADRNGVLHDERVDVGVVVERADPFEQVVLGGVGGDAPVEAAQPVALTGLVLAGHVAGAGRVVADEDGPEAGRAVAGGELGGPLAHVGEHGIGDGGAGHGDSGHGGACSCSGVRHLGEERKGRSRARLLEPGTWNLEPGTGAGLGCWNLRPAPGLSAGTDARR